jgi:hypothetical protein
LNLIAKNAVKKEFSAATEKRSKVIKRFFCFFSFFEILGAYSMPDDSVTILLYAKSAQSPYLLGGAKFLVRLQVHSEIRNLFKNIN